MVRKCLVVVAVATLTQSASAFYFEGWPGAGLTPRDSIFTPGGTSVTIGLGEIAQVEKPGERLKPPSEVPEPLSATLAACGLVAVGLWRGRRVKRPGGTAAG